ncbi:hypothetical protein [Streptomyces sp. NPDC050704]|uniref:hypothetical protein n=1 Tax=Streptomyces sp. NPDC050704 TaxID=3157219 RepID=UPI00342E3992
MTASTKPRMPVVFSDDLDRVLRRETREQTPDADRLTCPVHLDWRDRCRSWH